MSIDAIIEEYDTADFSCLKNKCIYFRSRGSQWNTSIYFVNTANGSCAPYVVEFDDENKDIIEIRNHLVLRSCGKDYLTKEEIEKAMVAYIEYHFCVIQVDDEGNVFINPNQQEVPVLLRKSAHTNPTDIDNFSLYKGNWYSRK